MVRLVRRFLRWVYDWVTIIGAMINGFIVALPEVLNVFLVVNIEPILETESALKIITYIALAKGLSAIAASKMMQKGPNE